MLAEHPDRWEVDQDDGHQHAVGIRHESGFKFHLPREQVVGPATPPAEKSAMSLMPSLSDMATSRLLKAISADQVKLGPDGEIIVAPEEEAPLTPEEQAQEDMTAISEQVAAMQRQRKAARPAYYDPRDWTAQVASALGLPDDGKYHPRTVKSAGSKCPNCHTTEGYLKLAGEAIICRECNRRSDTTEWEEANLKTSGGEKKASTEAKPAPLTGPEGIKAKLASLDLEALAAEQHAYIKSGKVSKRDKAVKILNIIEGLKRNKVKPEELMIHAVPVIPAVYRPFAMAGGTFIPGDANELYKDLFTFQKLHRETHKELGPEAGNEAGLQVYNAVKALYGYGEPVNPKTASRGVTGFFKSLVGTSPKYSFYQRALISKPMDNISRSTASVNPDLGVDEVGLPDDHAWKGFAPYVQARLVGLGYAPGDAVKAIRDRTPYALQALQKEMEVRPVIISRAPAWHKFNAVAQRARMVKGDSIQANPFVTTGMNLDFDGNCVKVGTKIMVAWHPDTCSSARLMKHANTQIRLNTKDTYVACIPIEDFPHLKGTAKKDRNGADVYEVPAGLKVLSPVEGKGMQWCDVTHFTHEKDTPCMDVVCVTGHSVTVSANESIAAFNSETGLLEKIKPADAVGRLVPLSRSAALPKTTMRVSDNPYEFGWLLGAFLSDGWIDENGMVGYTKSNAEHRIRFAAACSSYLGDTEAAFLRIQNYAETHGADNHSGICGDSSKIHIRLLKEHAAKAPRYAQLQGIFRDCYDPAKLERDLTTERSCLYKRLPQITWALPIEALYGLLAGLFDGDGSISSSEKPGRKHPAFTCNLATSSPHLRDSVMALAQFLGIRCSSTAQEPKKGRAQTHTSYVVNFSVIDIRRIAPWLQLTKANAAATLAHLRSVPDMQDTRDVVPVLKAELEELRKNKDLPCRNSITQTISKLKHTIAPVVSRQWVFALPEADLNRVPALRQRAETTSVLWTTIESATPAGKHDVYDLAVPETKVFAIANGLVVFDTMNAHVVASPEAVKEAYDKLLPSKMVFGIRDPDAVINNLKHEQILGSYAASQRPSQKQWKFGSKDEAISALKNGTVPLHDDVTFPGSEKLGTPLHVEV